MRCLKWKRINDFLEVSETGNVKSHGRLIKGEITRNGYVRIHVSDRGKHMKFLVHRLVAEAFLPNPENKPEVNHIDGDKQNNCVENLEWCTRSENQIHAYSHGLKNYDGVKNPNSKLTFEQVEEIRKLYVRGKHGENNSYGLAKKYGVSSKTIMNVVRSVHYLRMRGENDGTGKEF